MNLRVAFPTVVAVLAVFVAVLPVTAKIDEREPTLERGWQTLKNRECIDLTHTLNTAIPPTGPVFPLSPRPRSTTTVPRTAPWAADSLSNPPRTSGCEEPMSMPRHISSINSSRTIGLALVRRSCPRGFSTSTNRYEEQDRVRINRGADTRGDRVPPRRAPRGRPSPARSTGLRRARRGVSDGA